MKKILILMTLGKTFLLGSENFDALLTSYEEESSGSKITKSESAGFVDLYTRKDLDRMQARTLGDITKLFTIPFISRTSLNTTLFSKPSQNGVPTSGVRIYINDHDITPSAYRSGAMICDSITLDFIDYVEVYRSSASIEFGNEPSTVVIKLYTKRPAKEEGSKIRLTGDNKGSAYLSAYSAKTLTGEMSYLAYANVNEIQRDVYYNQGAALKSDSSNRNFYANLNYRSWTFEIGGFTSRGDSLLGLGVNVTPETTKRDVNYLYGHITKKFDNGVRAQVSVDSIVTDAQMIDRGGIITAGYGSVESYKFNNSENVYSLILDKTFKTSTNSLYIGGFVKHKTVAVDETFDGASTDFSTNYTLYSLFLENKYDIDTTTTLVASLKGDTYRYETKSIKDTNEYIFRLGAIKNIDKFQIKAFYTRTYYTAPLSVLYSGDSDTLYKTNGNLNFSQPTLYSLGVAYRGKKHFFNIRSSYIVLSNPIKYDMQEGFVNKNQTNYTQYEASYTYKYTKDSKISLDAYYGQREDLEEYSAPYGGHIVAYNSYGDFDLFNLLDYRAGYSNFGVSATPSYDWTSSIVYHATEDLLFGLKGENILDKGYKQLYRGLEYGINVFDRKFWLNMEYQF
ncbi:TonB-dependent receptor plug domain-containing protein [Sulfurimonas sp.]|uniref:TonB-dependent receptor plug domain-containing protein n=1 Tax=Sulfurimonas sp. TaxID=2022749 RepID=UPI0026299F26|nr:TonB-dependent receptor plug domain-containing protein [Sulfurimonas sp.]